MRAIARFLPLTVWPPNFLKSFFVFVLRLTWSSCLMGSWWGAVTRLSTGKRATFWHLCLEPDIIWAESRRTRCLRGGQTLFSQIQIKDSCQKFKWKAVLVRRRNSEDGFMLLFFFSLREKFPQQGSVKACFRNVKAKNVHIDLKRMKTTGVSFGCDKDLLVRHELYHLKSSSSFFNL